MESLQEAKSKFFSRVEDCQRVAAESIPTEAALGRITAAPVFAIRSAPGFHSAAMDGVAVRAEQTYGTTEREPAVLNLGREAVWINTGQPLPRGFDAVIMVEKLHQLDERRLEIRSPAYPWQNVRKVGEDIVASQLILPQNNKIRAYDIGALVSAGVFSVKVRQRPQVAIIPTGSELIDHRRIDANTDLEAGQIIETNSLVLAGLVRECDCEPNVYDIVPDREENIRRSLKQAIASNVQVVIINAGSSAGSKDHTMNILGELGEVLVHGVAMMPGKPTILAIVDGKPVVGNPGYSVSAIFSFEQFVKPLLYRLQGLRGRTPQTVEVRPTQDMPSRLGLEEFLRVNIGKLGSRYVATPLPRAAGSITTLTKAEGIIRIPALSEGISQQETAKAELLVEPEALANTVVFIGSHDITIDILGDEIRRQGRDLRISCGNVGSLGGLIALRKDVCHLTGAHLLDTRSGVYNLSYVERYLSGLPVSIYHLVSREQGLIVAKGNPRRIQGIRDLARKEVVFVNRQPGSGTRVLLDHKLKEVGINAEDIKGYDHVEFTHMAAAVDVLSGAADCTLGIFAAAKALDLDFLPVEREQYDLIIPEARLREANMQVIVETIRSRHFQDRVTALGGYDTSASGELWMKVGEGGDRVVQDQVETLDCG
jgi:putative molybdopterin biosynthesis protein